MDAAMKSRSGSAKIKVGNEPKMLEGKAMDKYQSRYKSMKVQGSSRPKDKKVGSASLQRKMMGNPHY